MIKLLDQTLDPAQALQRFTASVPGAGAIVSFTGVVRPKSSAGSVQNLFLQAYSPMTEDCIEVARNEAFARWKLDGAHIIHRIGNMAPGEPIVFVGTASKHRRDAFEAADYLMDYLKTEAVFWKKESCASGDSWIEPRAVDYDDAARWASAKGAP